MFEIPDTDITEVGRALGHDLYRFNRSRPIASPPGGDPGHTDGSASRHDDWPASVVEGHEQARARQLRREPADRYVRKWLQLRMGALRRERVVADDVTPGLLREIDVATCPVTRITLTHGERLGSDWSVDRLNNDGAYACTNLAVMSTRANLAKGRLSFEEVHALSQRDAPTDGLLPIEWQRMAALMLGPCFALQPRLAPLIPLCTPMPLRTARHAAEMIQHLMATLAGPSSGKNLLIKHFKAACPDERARARLVLLAEAVHQGLKLLAEAHDVWLKPGVMDALRRWREAMPPSAWNAAGEVARRLTNSGYFPYHRITPWQVEARGYLPRGRASTGWMPPPASLTPARSPRP